MASHTLSYLPIAVSNPRIMASKRIESPVSSSPIPLSSPLGKKLLVTAPKRCVFVPKRRCLTVSSTAFSVPTGQPEKGSSDKVPKWSARAIKARVMAELEARKLKYPNTGTEALLMGILVEGTSIAAKFLRENGITLFKVRDETLNLLGKSDMYFFSPEHPPLTEPAQKSIDWAVDEKTKSGIDGEITTAYMVLGIWAQKQSAGHKILESLGFNDEKAKELAKVMNDEIVLSYKKKGR
ncbi:PREDICTED: ATP-dependent Clp protease ATP-binding subunit CLPT1, chloroplastic [Tarenaya hassleriana]|uniref:ATP-dependent Clp protease ATP-binding subunit CLPT1, chloroplastic n=1 Tax=Tarenaya hassleriana TaxID=28532 RepID=UPI00053C21A8|nr:PREDICTED: ATP-dependent Clp protease ATP-binding subunit CLPT1, chloroplastic [Tarenaya hassleriana]